MRKTKEEAALTRQKILNAARRAFHKNGVAKTSLEKIAEEAGVTRGAIYWHFKDKTTLFFAMQEDVCKVIDARLEKVLFDPQWKNPLDAIAQMLKTFFYILQEETAARQIFEIMVLKCEYVGEFENVIETLMQPAHNLLKNLTDFYQKARELHLLRDDIPPRELAIDTAIYVNGLVYYLASQEIRRWEPNVEKLIDSHIAMRRKS